MSARLQSDGQRSVASSKTLVRSDINRMIPKPELADDTILVRPYCAADVPALYEAARESIIEVSRWLAWGHASYSISETTEFITSREEAWARGEEYSFGIFDKRSSRSLGGVGLNFINRIHQLGNLGYWVRTSHTRQGIASRAALLVARFGFEQLGLRRIEIVAAVDNIISQRVAEKTGAMKEGVLRNRLMIHGCPQDAVLYSLTPQDLRQNERMKDEG
jgi:ribosomal-protein-serine acetyltransferase